MGKGKGSIDRDEELFDAITEAVRGAGAEPEPPLRDALEAVRLAGVRSVSDSGSADAVRRSDDIKGPWIKWDHGDFVVYCVYIDGRWICSRHDK